MVEIGNADRVLIVGAGIFGLAAALELAERGYRVTVVDREVPPHALAASNDVSRMVRVDYGGDRLYCRLAGEAIAGWRRWNSQWGRDLYHQDGLLLLSSRPLEEGGYEGDSYQTLSGIGWPLQRLTSKDISRRFPGWNSDYYADGYFNPRGGWAEAGAVISRMAADVQAKGVSLRISVVSSLLRSGGRVRGVVTEAGEQIESDRVVVAAGVWTPDLLPELDGFLQLSGQPVLYFKPADPQPFQASSFPPWGADLATSGWYGFPANPDGIVKIGRHGPGHAASPDAARVLPDREDEARCRQFLSHSLPALADAPLTVEGTRDGKTMRSHSLPALADAPLAASKMCIYTDTWDGNFLISRHPELDNLTVATGGSGHGFKFGPVLGRLAADAVEGVANPYLGRFEWRPVGNPATESARYTG